jgi:hypothetical protein
VLEHVHEAVQEDLEGAGGGVSEWGRGRMGQALGNGRGVGLGLQRSRAGGKPAHQGCDVARAAAMGGGPLPCRPRAAPHAALQRPFPRTTAGPGAPL